MKIIWTWPVPSVKKSIPGKNTQGYLQPNGDIIVNGDWIGKVEEN